MNEQEDWIYAQLNKAGDFNGKDKPSAYPIGKEMGLWGRFTLCQLVLIVELMKEQEK